jgi:hypothetical protein
MQVNLKNRAIFGAIGRAALSLFLRIDDRKTRSCDGATATELLKISVPPENAEQVRIIVRPHTYLGPSSDDSPAPVLWQFTEILLPASQ